MSKSQSNILELAKQGNPKAIATIINRQLEPKGIIAQVDLKNECLHIVIESVELPEKVTIVKYFRRSFITLNAASIKTIQIYAKQTVKPFCSWDDSFNLVESASPETLQISKNIYTKEQQENNRDLQIKFDEVKNEFANHLFKTVLISMGFSIIAVEVSSTKSKGNGFSELAGKSNTMISLINPSNAYINGAEALVFAVGVTIITSIAQGIIDRFTSANDFYQEGKNFMKNKLYSEALSSFAKAIAKNKGYTDAFYQRGYIFFLTGNYTKAYEEFNQVISIVPGHIEAYKKRALVRYALQDYDGAISDNTFVINQKSDDYESYFYRAITYFTTGAYTESLDDFTRAIELNCQNYLIYLMRANMYLSINNNPDKAIQDFNIV
ncbi:tetratricopeptide repeat protein [Nostoc sp.]|uniref:tetratricopeptide repeat protein n=1 Tax=Nostoc sp. TaxID=1180 RepID=UPI002FF6E665